MDKPHNGSVVIHAVHMLSKHSKSRGHAWRTLRSRGRLGLVELMR